MFVLQNREVVAPVTTAVFPTIAANATVSDYLENFKAGDMNTKATIGAIIATLASSANEPNAGDDTDAVRVNCRACFRPGVAQAFMALLAAAPANPAAMTDDELVIAAINVNRPNAANWFVNLHNAAKKKPLTESNVEGFFAMLGHTGTKASAVSSLINKTCPFFPDHINHQAFRNTLIEGVWTTYRNTRVSTGKILHDLLPDFRNLGITTVGDATEAAITASMNAPWDLNLSLQIPEKYKAYGCLFHEAAGTPIDRWYQGNKARDNLPAARVRGAKEIFRRYLEVKNNVANLNAMNAVADFANPAIAAFF